MNAVSGKALFGVAWRVQFARIFLVLIFSAITAGFLPSLFGEEFSDLREGAVSPRDIDAPFDFEILKDPDQLAQERFEARRGVAPVVELNDTLVMRMRQQFTELTAQLESRLQLLATMRPDSSKRVLIDRLQADNQINLPSDAAEWLLLRAGSDLATITDAFSRWRRLQQIIYTQGILYADPGTIGTVVTAKQGSYSTRRDAQEFITEPELPEVLLTRLRETEPAEEAIRAGYALLRPMLLPNWVYNERETDRLRSEAANRVPSAQGVVLNGERIIERGKRISEEQLQVLRSLADKRGEMQAARGFWGHFLPRFGPAFATFMVLALWGATLLTLRPAKVKRFADFMLAQLLLVAPALVLGYGILPAEWSYMFFPAGAIAMTLAILYDIEIALIGVGALTALAGIVSTGRLSLVLMTMLSGSAALVVARGVSTRAHMFRAVPAVFAAALMAILARAASEMMWSHETMRDLYAAAISAIAAPLLVYGIVFVAEKSFKLTTDLTYLELADFNRPILRRLAFETPGTFHHSILVGALAEAGARAIGANPILARCAAYYHDIGKLENREYFIENQSGKNPHEEIRVEESTEILRNHVKGGIELGRQLKLPEEVIAAIPEHHGTMIMRFFYNRASQQNTVVDERNFRYRGPRPRTRETALLMLADGCEAVSRTLKPADGDELHAAVNKIILERMADGQLDHAPLTFRDMRRIESAFVTVLDGILHKRIVYPELKRSKKEASA